MGVEIQLFEFGAYRSYALAERMLTIFQHDGAAVLYIRLVTHHINLTFPERWIGRGGQVQWPPMSSDLLSCRFLSLGMYEERSLQLKSKHKRRIGRSHYE
jgi:hypothetical protein